MSQPPRYEWSVSRQWRNRSLWKEFWEKINRISRQNPQKWTCHDLQITRRKWWSISISRVKSKSRQNTIVKVARCLHLLYTDTGDLSEADCDLTKKKSSKWHSNEGVDKVWIGHPGAMSGDYETYSKKFLQELSLVQSSRTRRHMLQQNTRGKGEGWLNCSKIACRASAYCPWPRSCSQWL